MMGELGWLRKIGQMSEDIPAAIEAYGCVVEPVGNKGHNTNNALQP